jgi:arsenite methyltransferase
MAQVDVSELRDKVKVMYKAVAEEPHGTFHFEMGRDLALRLGYPAGELDRLPPEAIESFAGVGYHLGLAAVTRGERVVDLGSGSGTDLFLTALHAGAQGEVVGVDMTEEQLAKARRLAARDGYDNVRLELGYIEYAPVADRSADVSSRAAGSEFSNAAMYRSSSAQAWGPAGSVSSPAAGATS